MPFGLQPTHLIIIAVVALIMFGPSRLPEFGRAFGKTLKEFQSAIKDTAQSLSDEVQKPVDVKKEEPSATVAAQSLSDEVQKPVDVKKEEPPATVACKNCGKSVQAGMKFCPDCGAAQ